MIRRWDAETGEPKDAVAIGSPEDPLAVYAGESGCADLSRLRRLPHVEAE